MRQRSKYKIHAGEALVRCLEKEGVEYLFGVPGTHLLTFLDSVQKSPQLKAVLTKHEEGAAFMADGYARVSGKIGVCFTTLGPGATNAVTGIATSYMDGIPVLLITAQTPTFTFGRGGHQEATGEGRTIDQVGMFKNVAKVSTMVISGRQVPLKVRYAFRTALAWRYGPVHLCIPPDVLNDQVDFTDLNPEEYRATDPQSIDVKKIQRAAEIIQQAKKPVIIVGTRAIFPDCSSAINELATTFGIPVITTVNIKGILPELDPLSLGCLGYCGSPVADHYLKEADVVVAIGESFLESTTVGWDQAYVPSNALIQIDTDFYEIGKNYPVTVSAIGEMRASILALKEALIAKKYDNNKMIKEIIALKEHLRYFNEEKQYSEDTPIKPQRFLTELRKCLPKETIVFADSGNTLQWVLRYFPAYPRSFYAANSLAPMGYAVAAAIGGKIAAPKRPVVTICGDGAFQMNGMEVMTAVNYNIPVTWVVFDEGRLNMVYDSQKEKYGNRIIATTFKNPDFVKLADAYGADGYRIEKPNQIKDVIQVILQRNKPAIISVRIDPDEPLPKKPLSMIIANQLGLRNENNVL